MGLGGGGCDDMKVCYINHHDVKKKPKNQQPPKNQQTNNPHLIKNLNDHTYPISNKKKKKNLIEGRKQNDGVCMIYRKPAGGFSPTLTLHLPKHGFKLYEDAGWFWGSRVSEC